MIDPKKTSLWSLLGFIALLSIPIGIALSALPDAGEWGGTAGFGEIGFEVNPEGTEIEEITLSFSDYTCGGITYSGTMTVSSVPAVSISDGQFEEAIVLGTDPILDSEQKITIGGDFNDLGNSAFGLYEADFSGTLCDGTWQAFPEGTNTATVSGTLTYPSDVAGKTYGVVIDYDGDGDTEDWVAIESGTCGTGTSVDFTMEVPEGEYYAYAVVWVVGTDYADIETGDYMGYYGETFAPNLIVPSSGTVTCDIDLSLYTDTGDDAGDDNTGDDDTVDDNEDNNGDGSCFISNLF